MDAISGAGQRLSSSAPSVGYSDLGKTLEISKTNEKKERNSVIGVIRLRNAERMDSLDDNTSVDDDSVFLNDLSSVDCSRFTSSQVPDRHMLSFKNI